MGYQEVFWWLSTFSIETLISTYVSCIVGYNTLFERGFLIINWRKRSSFFRYLNVFIWVCLIIPIYGKRSKTMLKPRGLVESKVVQVRILSSSLKHCCIHPSAAGFVGYSFPPTLFKAACTSYFRFPLPQQWQQNQHYPTPRFTTSSEVRLFVFFIFYFYPPVEHNFRS